MKRIYFVAIFLLFLLLVVIGFKTSINSISGRAVSSEGGVVPTEFSSFGIIAATVLVLLSYFWIRNFKKEKS